MPKESLPFCEPASDWKTRPTGAPDSRHFICVVTWDKMQFCVGICHVWITS
jgi:hypothetical protein